jgi:hemin uptake protein HemP
MTQRDRDRDITERDIPERGDESELHADDATANAAVSRDGPPTISSDEILRGGRVAIIRHKNEEYRLIETRHGRLLLQK